MTNENAKAMLKEYSERINAYKQSELTLKFGFVIKFGTYKGKPLEWIIIDEEEGMIKLLSKDIINNMKYNNTLEDITWEKCTLRKWLNEDFYNTFTSDEKNKIIKLHLSNKDTYFGKEFTLADSNNYLYHAAGGNDTEDYIYLLSIDETQNLTNEILQDKFQEFGWWWLRSPGGTQDRAAVVDSFCSFGPGGDKVSNENGVRPVLNIKSFDY